MFGHTGSGPGCFRDPAGLAVDRLPVLNVVCGFSAGWQSLCVDIIFAHPASKLNCSVLETCWWRTAGTTGCASMTPTADF